MKSLQFLLGTFLLLLALWGMFCIERTFAQTLESVADRPVDGISQHTAPTDAKQTDDNRSIPKSSDTPIRLTESVDMTSPVETSSTQETSSMTGGVAMERPTIDDLIPLDHSSPGEITVVTDAQGNAMIPFFGHTVRGNHVVFLIDRSMSTGGRGNLTLPLIRAQVHKALAGLGDVQRFELIVYSDTPRLYNPTGNRGKIAFANEENKERAIVFLDKIRPQGNTDHLPAIRLALELRPDFVFWLTDGDEPRLSREELNQIRDWATGVRIYTIEFGVGKEPLASGFLKTVALENGGKYQWVDLVQALKEWQQRQPQEK